MSEAVSENLDASVAVTVGGETYRLEPAISAYRHIGRFYGSLAKCAERVLAYDVDAVAAVIVAGTGRDFTPEEADALALAYFREPVKAAAADACSDYLVLLHRGGVPEDPGAKTEEKEADPGNS